jgi:hypothetical protein
MVPHTYNLLRPRCEPSLILSYRCHGCHGPCRQTLPKFSLTMAAKPKSTSSQPSKRWAMTTNNSENQQSFFMASVKEEFNQSGSSLYPCHHTEYITFNVVDMLYPYNAIFGRGLLNTIEATLHSSYLCLKIPVTFGVISVFGSQQDDKNIEKGFTPSHKNVHFCEKSKRKVTPLSITLKL